MKAEYDFSKGERGKFYIPRDKIRLPYYLDPDVEKRLFDLAAKTGKDPGTLASAILDTELRLLETLK
jgi:hypothetical protein